MIRIAAIAGLALLGLLTAATGVWGVLAPAYSGPQSDVLRYSLAAAFGLASLAALMALGVRGWRWRAVGAYLVLFALLLVWWRGIEPSNKRDWQADVAKLAYAEIEGDIVTVRIDQRTHAGAGDAVDRHTVLCRVQLEMAAQSATIS